ncbi:MAG TPA: peroxiredoxin [Kofleriaceae bacterium]|nr:peroxiredoxin [Kofleriaceae bacterium]
MISVLAAALGVGGCKKDDKGTPKEAAKPEAAAPAPTSQLLTPGAELPALDTVAHDGTALKSTELKGAPLVVYFYPKDETGGCNAEAEAFRDAKPELDKLGARLVGVSLDTVEAHKAFAEGHQLNFPLIADPDQKVTKAFGVPVQEGYADRVTFVFGRDGKVAKVWPDVSVDGHAAEVVAAVRDAAAKP